MKYPDTIPTDSHLWVVESTPGGVDSFWLNKAHAWHHADAMNKRMKEHGCNTPSLRVRSYPTQIGEALIGGAYPEVE